MSRVTWLASNAKAVVKKAAAKAAGKVGDCEVACSLMITCCFQVGGKAAGAKKGASVKKPDVKKAAAKKIKLAKKAGAPKPKVAKKAGGVVSKKV